MEFGKFMRECYLRSTPSVDLNDVTDDKPVDCRQHTLPTSEYEKILEEFGVKCGTDIYCGCNMWMLQSGPKLVNDTPA